MYFLLFVVPFIFSLSIVTWRFPLHELENLNSFEPDDKLVFRVSLLYLIAGFVLDYFFSQSCFFLSEFT